MSDTQLQALENLTGTPLRQLAAHSSSQGPQITFERPELSPCLTKNPALSAAKRAEALAIIRTGQRLLQERPEADMPGFQSCSMDQWRNKKYLARQQVELNNRKAVATGQKLFDGLTAPVSE